MTLLLISIHFTPLSCSSCSRIFARVLRSQILREGLAQLFWLCSNWPEHSRCWGHSKSSPRQTWHSGQNCRKIISWSKQLKICYFFCQVSSSHNLPPLVPCVSTCPLKEIFLPAFSYKPSSLWALWWDSEGVCPSAQSQPGPPVPHLGPLKTRHVQSGLFPQIFPSITHRDIPLSVWRRGHRWNHSTAWRRGDSWVDPRSRVERRCTRHSGPCSGRATPLSGPPCSSHI